VAPSANLGEVSHQLGIQLEPLFMAFRLNVQLLRGLRKVPEQGGAEPAFQVQLGRVVPVAATVFAPPVEGILVSWKRRDGEDQRKAMVGARTPVRLPSARSTLKAEPIDGAASVGGCFFLLPRARREMGVS